MALPTAAQILNLKTFAIITVLLLLVAMTSMSWISGELLGEPLCKKWHLGMTKKEKINLAIVTTNSLQSVRFAIKDTDTGATYFTLSKQIPYAQASEILVRNPECCRIYSESSAQTETPSELVDSRDEGVVFLNYQGQFKDSAGNIQKAPISEFANFNLCKD